MRSLSPQVIVPCKRSQSDLTLDPVTLITGTFVLIHNIIRYLIHRDCNLIVGREVISLESV